MSAQVAFQVGGLQISANSSHDFTFPVIPLAIGQHCLVQPIAPLDSSWNSLTWHCFVSALNVLTVRVTNPTVGAITPVAQNFCFRSFFDASL
jgi:hypothetical protein